ncbi:MAG: hypothetical protein ACI4TH_06330 [Candidatus Ornithomonoglobus sp.]
MRKYEDPSIMISVFNEIIAVTESGFEVKGTNLVESTQIYTITKDALEFKVTY